MFGKPIDEWEDILFKNVGRKISRFAVGYYLIAEVFLGVALALCILFMDPYYKWYIIGMLVGTGIAVYLNLMIIYAFGVIVDNVSSLKSQFCIPVKTERPRKIYDAAPVIPARGDSDWFCTNCGKGNIDAVTSCQYCGKYRASLENKRDSL